ncbi:MAG: hypothetical protein CMJ19_22940 [Phycisphaeraceae bacterium]|nr:hypothetical protein [Phycisphaeraceae bacterium]
MGLCPKPHQRAAVGSLPPEAPRKLECSSDSEHQFTTRSSIDEHAMRVGCSKQYPNKHFDLHTPDIQGPALPGGRDPAAERWRGLG